MRHDALGQRDARGHQERGPVHAVEAHNFLPNHLQIGWPVSFELAGIARRVAESRDVVGQRIQPDIDHVFGIVRHRNAPGKRAAADGKVLQSTFDERNDFVATRFRANPLRLFGIEAQELVGKCRELEEVILLVHGFGDAAALRAALPRADVHVHLVRNAVLSGVAALVDVAVLAELAEQGLHAFLMTFFGGANEVVVGEAHPIPQGAKFCGYFVGKLLRGLAGSSGGALDFLAVFIRARQEIGVVAEHAMAARNGVAGNGRVRMPDVRTGVDVIDRGRDVELFAHEKRKSLPQRTRR